MTDSLEGKDSSAALFHKAQELDSSKATTVKREGRKLLRNSTCQHTKASSPRKFEAVYIFISAQPNSSAAILHFTCQQVKRDSNDVGLDE